MATANNGSRGALSGVRVLDLSRVLAAPYGAQILGDLGADVIKVERRSGGDDARHYGVHALPDAAGGRSGDTSFFLSANRNKRSLTLEIGTPEGRAVLLDLIARSDVLIENFKAGTMARFGLDYETACAANPAIIYCSVTGYGQSGPYAARPGYDAVFQAQSGLMNVTGLPDEAPGGGPVKFGPSMVDVMTGMNVAIAVLAALRHRDATGEGQMIDIALLDSAIASASHSAMEYLISGETLPRNGNLGNGGAPSQTLACRDGPIYVTAGNGEQFTALCDTLGLPRLIDEQHFATSPLRYRHRAELMPILEAAAAARGRAELVTALSAAGVPAGVVNDYAAAFADPQVAHRGTRIELPHPVVGAVSLIASPLRLSATPPTYREPPPQLGAHSDAILGDLLGLDAGAIAALRARGVV